MKRGSNQSSYTKYATCLLCDALAMLESGRISSARTLVMEALSRLPEIDDPLQAMAEAEVNKTRRGFHA